MYKVEKVFEGDVYVQQKYDGYSFKKRERILYRLDTQVYAATLIRL